MKGPAIFLAQFAGDAAPFNDLHSIATWAASLGYKGVQIPSWDRRLFDLDRRACNSRNCPLICRASLSRCIRPMTRRSTVSRHNPSVAIPRRASNGRSSN